jgi:hypothetical protein
MPQVGILVVEDIAIEARINFETALREHGVSTETTVLEFSTGSGAGLAVTIIAAIAGVVSILKNGPDAWENSKNGVRKIIAILRKMMASESLDCDLNVESLKNHASSRHLWQPTPTPKSPTKRTSWDRSTFSCRCLRWQ